jgi:hypothetical protein
MSRIVRPLSALDLDPNPVTQARVERNWRLLRRLLMERPSGPSSAPTAPSDLHSTAIAYNSIDLAWTDNSSDELGFRVAYSMDGAAWMDLGDTAAGIAACTHAGLTPETTYYYRVRAIGVDANSAWSATVSVTTINDSGRSWFDEPPSTSNRNDYTGNLGCAFTLHADASVSKLGRLYVAGNTQDHTIRLWRTADQTLLVTATVLAASVSDGDGFKWVDITPLTLTAGTSYTIACYENDGGDEWLEWNIGTAMDPVVDAVISKHSGSAGMPINTGGSNHMFSTPALWFELA